MNKKPFFENLDTLRFLSFLVVFCFHVHLYDAVALLTNSSFILVPLRVVCAGGWGVTFFFVLSGFLITWLLLSEKEQMKRINIKAFYLRRVFRIWPLYYFVIATGFIVLPFVYKLTHTPLVFDYPLGWYLVFLSNFACLILPAGVDRSFPLVLDISWSVSIEEQFYLIWPLLFLIKGKWAKYVIPSLFIFISIVHAFVFQETGMIYLSTFSRIADLSIGGLAAALFYDRKEWLDKFSNLSRVWIILIYVCSFILISLSFKYTAPLTKYAINFAGAILFAGIICEQNFSKKSPLKFGRFKLLGYWGRRSYGLYMLHPICIFFASGILKIVLNKENPVASGWWFITASFILTLLVAWVSFQFYEKPFLRLKANFEKLK